MLGKLREIIDESSACGLVSVPTTRSQRFCCGCRHCCCTPWTQLRCLLSIQQCVSRHRTPTNPFQIWPSSTRAYFLYSVPLRGYFVSCFYNAEVIFMESQSCWTAVFFRGSSLFLSGGGLAAEQIWEGGGAVLDGAAVPAASASQGKCERRGCSKWDTAGTLVAACCAGTRPPP